MNFERDKQRKADVMEYLKLKTHVMFEWYKDCNWCEETKDNIYRDLYSILREAESLFDVKIPITWRVSCTDYGMLDIVAVSKEVS